ncbi:hypothetical protein [Rheinheimera salexigens]|nr:hypothetical protein [Rheinheimera salexigens]
MRQVVDRRACYASSDELPQATVTSGYAAVTVFQPQKRPTEVGLYHA